MDDRSLIPGRGRDFFSLRYRVQIGSYPMGTGGSFPDVKRLGHEANHSPPSSAENRNAQIYTSTPPYVFIAWCLVKHRDNFIFTSL
jgi:hypothetical protein